MHNGRRFESGPNTIRLSVSLCALWVQDYCSQNMDEFTAEECRGRFPRGLVG